VDNKNEGNSSRKRRKEALINIHYNLYNQIHITLNNWRQITKLKENIIHHKKLL
jgi:hypothetical protein